jgi:hypothetical protein
MEYEFLTVLKAHWRLWRVNAVDARLGTIPGPTRHNQVNPLFLLRC